MPRLSPTSRISEQPAAGGVSGEQAHGNERAGRQSCISSGFGLSDG
jgi:hypothetical protein